MGLREFNNWFFGADHVSNTAKPIKSKEKLDAASGSSSSQLKIAHGETISDFLERTRADSQETGDRVDFVRTGFQALRDQRRQEDIEKYGKGWWGRMKKKFNETEIGVSVQVGTKSLIGGGMMTSAFLLGGEYMVTAAPALAIAGGVLYGQELLRYLLYLGEEKTRELYGSTRRAFRIELKSMPKEQRFSLTQDILKKIERAEYAMMEARQSLRSAQTRNKFIVFGLPKLVAAGMVSGGIPVPVGFHDWDGITPGHPVFTDFAKNALYYANQHAGKVGVGFGNFITRNTALATQATLDAARVGAGAGLIAADVAQKLFDASMASAQQALGALEKKFEKKPTIDDIKKISVRPVLGEKKADTADFDVSRAGEELIAEHYKKALPPRFAAPSHMQEALHQETIWHGDPKEQRAHILQALGLAREDIKQISYKAFVAAIKNALSDADPLQIEVVKDFLAAQSEKLSSEQGSPVLMWTDRRHIEKLIAAQKAKKEETGTPMQKENESSSQPLGEPVYTLEDLIREGEDNLKRLRSLRKESARSQNREVPQKAQEMLSILMKRRQDRLGEKDNKSRALLQEQISELHDINRIAAARLLIDEIDRATSLSEAAYQEGLFYHEAWEKANHVEILKNDSMRVRKDKKKEWLYRGGTSLPFDSSSLSSMVFRGRMNIQIYPRTIRKLDELIRDGAAFIYRIGDPGTRKSAVYNHESVKIFFQGKPKQETLQALSHLAMQYKRGSGENLVGTKYQDNPHFYLSEQFIGSISSDKKIAFLERLKIKDPEIAAVVESYIGENGEITEAKFNAIKKMLNAFGYPIEYNPERGIVFIKVEEKRKSAA